MIPQPNKFQDNLEEFLGEDLQLSLDEVKAELVNEGVDLDAFLQRVRGMEAPASATRTVETPPPVRTWSMAETGAGKTTCVASRDLFFLSLPSDQEERFHYSRFPLREMIKRGWMEESLDSVRSFFSHIPDSSWNAVLCRKSESVRSKRKMSHEALIAWTTRIIVRMQQMRDLKPFIKGCVTEDLMKEVVLRSRGTTGPSDACALLREHGIPVVIEPHLPHTYLDGAAIMVMEDRPIIGLTIRHDRLDNFWFTLLHELAHLRLHSSLGQVEFFDDLDHRNTKDPRETEADQLAGEMLIPEAVWRTSPASRSRMPLAVENLANKLKIHPAIVAGRIHHESKAFHAFNKYLGHNAVRKEFPGVKWPA